MKLACSSHSTNLSGYGIDHCFKISPKQHPHINTTIPIPSPFLSLSLISPSLQIAILIPCCFTRSLPLFSILFADTQLPILVDLERHEFHYDQHPLVVHSAATDKMASRSETAALGATAGREVSPLPHLQKVNAKAPPSLVLRCSELIFHIKGKCCHYSSDCQYYHEAQANYSCHSSYRPQLVYRVFTCEAHEEGRRDIFV